MGKEEERKKGVNFSPYQFPGLIHDVTAWALVPAQSVAWKRALGSCRERGRTVEPVRVGFYKLTLVSSGNQEQEGEFQQMLI